MPLTKSFQTIMTENHSATTPPTILRVLPPAPLSLEDSKTDSDAQLAIENARAAARDFVKKEMSRPRDRMIPRRRSKTFARTKSWTDGIYDDGYSHDEHGYTPARTCGLPAMTVERGIVKIHTENPAVDASVPHAAPTQGELEHITRGLKSREDDGTSMHAGTCAGSYGENAAAAFNDGVRAAKKGSDLTAITPVKPSPAQSERLELMAKMAKLPTWARDHMEKLQREKDAILACLCRFAETKKPSPIYIEDHVNGAGKCWKDSIKRNYIQDDQVTIEAHGVKLRINTKHGSTNGNSITATFQRSDDAFGQVAIEPIASNQIRFITKDSMR